ncbi:MAG: ferritin-like domain-containing protein, partial [Planctomycetota bacterium]
IKPHHFYYGGGGESIEVHNLPTATKALEEVIEQGEGLDHTIFDGDTHFGQQEEVAHYFRFNEMLVGRYYLDTDTPSSGPTGGEFPVDWSAVWNMAPNPKAARYADQPEVFEKMADFNRGYTRLLGTLDRAFNGAPDELIPAVPEMYELRQAAQRLMKIPTGEGDTRVGPSFEYWED